MSVTGDQLSRWPNNSGLVWTADSREILYVMDHTVMAVTAEHGTSRSLGLKIPDLLEISSLAPDGKRLAFTAGAGNREVWVIENLLPPHK